MAVVVNEKLDTVGCGCQWETGHGWLRLARCVCVCVFVCVCVCVLSAGRNHE